MLPPVHETLEVTEQGQVPFPSTEVTLILICEPGSKDSSFCMLLTVGAAEMSDGMLSDVAMMVAPFHCKGSLSAFKKCSIEDSAICACPCLAELSTDSDPLAYTYRAHIDTSIKMRDAIMTSTNEDPFSLLNTDCPSAMKEDRRRTVSVVDGHGGSRNHAGCW